MSGYEGMLPILPAVSSTNSSPVEHNIPANEGESTQPSRRPDLSTFFSTLEQIDTSGEHTQHNNAHALPLPGDVAAAFRTLANAFEMMRGGEEREREGPSNDLLGQLVETLMASANDPPREVNGVPDSFIDDLDRVPKSKLKKEEDCPICGNPFLDGTLSDCVSAESLANTQIYRSISLSCNPSMP
jgi:hypothetical protein